MGVAQLQAFLAVVVEDDDEGRQITLLADEGPVALRNCPR